MKRLIVLLLVLALLSALCACDLRNRQNSEDFIPTESGGALPDVTVPTANDPAAPAEHSVVKTVLFYEGEIHATDPLRSYSYSLPMIDLAGTEAIACNLEIEERFGELIRQSLSENERWREPILERLSYSSFTMDGILTLRIIRQDLDGSVLEAWYTVDAADGDAVTVRQLFKTARIDGSPEQTVEQAAEDRFRELYGSPADPDPAWTTALTRTREEILPLTVNRMHLTEDGRLTVAVMLYAPDGGSSVEALRLP